MEPGVVVVVVAGAVEGAVVVADDIFYALSPYFELFSKCCETHTLHTMNFEESAFPSHTSWNF